MTTAPHARDYGARMAIAGRLRTRVLGLDQRWIDLALAAVVGLWFAVELLTRDPRGTDRLATAVTGAVVVLALVWRTRHVAVACVVFTAVVALQGPLDGGFMDYLDSSFAALFALLYTLGRRTDGVATLVLAGLLYVSASAALSISEDETVVQELLWGLGLCAPPVLAGRALRTHRRVRDDLEAAQRSLAEVEEARAARAVEDERTRIASELQTVLANDVSAIVVQAEAVHRILAVGERELAADSLRVIEDTGREALGEMRRLLGVLRHDLAGPSLAPQPGVAEIARLARRRAGDAPGIRVDVTGEPVAVSPGIDLAAFWIAERAVESAAAAGAQDVHVAARHERGRIVLRVSDDRPPTHASEVDAALLAAMRARADLYGGQIHAGRADDRRVLDVSLPLRGAEVAA
jgi:signal transduction histidine kinase